MKINGKYLITIILLAISSYQLKAQSLIALLSNLKDGVIEISEFADTLQSDYCINDLSMNSESGCKLNQKITRGLNAKNARFDKSVDQYNHSIILNGFGKHRAKSLKKLEQDFTLLDAFFKRHYSLIKSGSKKEGESPAEEQFVFSRKESNLQFTLQKVWGGCLKQRMILLSWQ